MKSGYETSTTMAHLPDDDLPSQFDVVVDGTGKQLSVQPCLSDGRSLEHRSRAEHPGGCTGCRWKIGSTHRWVRTLFLVQQLPPFSDSIHKEFLLWRAMGNFDAQGTSGVDR